MEQKRSEPDPDERFAIDGDPEDVLKRLLSGAGTEDVSEDPDEGEGATGEA